MDDLVLERPDGLAEGTWRAIERSRQRLARAVEAGDRSQAIGCAKDLVETVAKVVVTERGQVVDENAQLTGVLGRAHDALDRQPGRGLSGARPVARIAQSARTAVAQLAELRNDFGTGHGRAYEPDVEQEMADLGVAASMLWSRWALRRLGHLLLGMPTPLIADLEQGAIFRGGNLRDRLEATNLQDLEAGEQQRVGVAVAQRAMRGTFAVAEDGVQVCANSDDLARWPVGYRRGLADGLFFDQFGHLHVNEWAAEWVPRVLAPLPDPDEPLAYLRDKAVTAVRTVGWLNREWGLRLRVYQSLLAGSDLIPSGSRDLWNELAALFDPEPS